MTDLKVADMTAQIDKLLLEWESLRARAKFPDLSDLRDELRAFVVRLRSALERLAPPSSSYIREMASVSENNTSTAYRVQVYIGVLQALRADASEGWLVGVSELFHADTFNDLIEQAIELAEKNYKDPAAVVIGSVLEAHLRLLCKKYGIKTQLAAGRWMKADAMNSELVRALSYNSLQQKAVTSWLAIRNAAAHGDYEKYSRGQVTSMIDGVRHFILAYPA